MQLHGAVLELLAEDFREGGYTFLLLASPYL